MKIAFTICSNNYWAQAKVLFQSMVDTNPDYTLVLGLVDKKHTNIDYVIKNGSINVIEVAELNIPEEYNIFKKYNIIELNTAVKASYIKWIKKNYPDTEIILYFDPDIKIFSTLKEIETALISSSIVLTPHIYNPIPIDNLCPQELSFLNYGIFNLGFIGVSFQNKDVYNFLNWWEERLMKQCFIELVHGLFVDQLPINFAPIFFSKITKKIENYGMNVAPWNLHERHISLRNGIYYANEDKLIFFHFSNICFKKGKHPNYNRYEIYPELEDLHEGYRNELINNSFIELKSIPCAYKVKPLTPSIWKRVQKELILPILRKILKKK